MSKTPLILKRINEGLPPARIALECDVSESYVRGLRWKQNNPDKWETIRRRYSAEWYRRKKHELPSPPPRQWSEEEFASALEMKRAGKSATQIAVALNRSRNSVIGRLWRTSA